MATQDIEEIPGLPQLFVLRDTESLLRLVISKVVDDFLVYGPRSEIEAFHSSLSVRFEVGRFFLGGGLIFNRLHISQKLDRTVVLNMREYMDKILPMVIPTSRRKFPNTPSTTEEIKLYQGLGGSLNFPRHEILPQACFFAIILQQSIVSLTVSGLLNASICLSEPKTLDCSLTFSSVTFASSPSYLAFSDASHGSTYGQTGYVSAMFLPGGGAVGRSVFHVIDWISSKQVRVSFSSVGAEIIAAATTTDRCSLLAERITLLYGSLSPLPFVLTVDSNGFIQPSPHSMKVRTIAYVPPYPDCATRSRMEKLRLCSGYQGKRTWPTL